MNKSNQDMTTSTRSYRSTRSLGALVEFLTKPRYAVVKKFVGGTLDGLEYVDNSLVPFEIGKTYGYGTTYIVIDCWEITD